MYTGPKLTNDNLVFGYDTGYGIADNNTTTRFYQGEPVTNLWDSMLNTQSLRTHTKHYWNGIKWTEDSTYTHPGVNGPKDTYLGLVFKHTSGALNSSWSGNSYGYMLRDIACTSGATMTMSSWVYASTDCDVSSIPAAIEGESGGETTISGYPASYDLNNKGTWQVLAKKANSDGNVRFIPLYPRKNGVSNGSFAGFFMWALPQVAYGDRVVPPIQPGATRSNTASLIDLKKTTDIDVGDVSFDSTGQPEFDGTNDEIEIAASDWNKVTEVTVEAIVLVKGTPIDGNAYHVVAQKDGAYSGGAVYGIRINGSNAPYGTFSKDATSAGTHVNTVSGTTMTANKYYHLVYTRKVGESVFYQNGEQKSISTANNDAIYNNTDTFTIGQGDGRQLYGNIPVLKVHNSVLSATEIADNFNAYKNRFNL